MRLFVLPSLLVLLGACTSTTIEYPNSCPLDEVESNTKCQRNLDAQTLAIIGYEDAATQLLCKDPELRAVLDDKCKQ